MERFGADGKGGADERLGQMKGQGMGTRGGAVDLAEEEPNKLL